MNKVGSWEMAAAMVICGTIGITVLHTNHAELSIIFYRCFFGAVVLLAFAFYQGLFRQGITARVILWSSLGGFALLANWYFLFSAYTKTSIGIATTVYNLQPLIMIVFGIILFKERVTANMMLWIAISLSGLLFISKTFGTEQHGGDSINYLIGTFEAFLAALLYAVAAIITRKLTGTPPTLIAAIQMTLGALILFPFANLDVILSPQLDGPTFAIVLLGVLHTGVMYVLLYGAIQKIEAWRVASISFLYPALAIAIDALFLQINLGLGQWIGIGLILLGAAGINLKWTLPKVTIFRQESN